MIKVARKTIAASLWSMNIARGDKLATPPVKGPAITWTAEERLSLGWQ